MESGKKRKTDDSVSRSRPEKFDAPFDYTAKLFVGGVNSSIGKDKLIEVFESYGRIREVSNFPDKGRNK